MRRRPCVDRRGRGDIYVVVPPGRGSLSNEIVENQPDTQALGAPLDAEISVFELHHLITP